MITVKIQGGLGNQMFQYAFGRALSHLHKVPLSIDTSLFATYPHHAYGLDRYCIHTRTSTQKEARRFARMKPRLGRRHLLHTLLFGNPERYIVERQFNFDPDMLTLRHDAYYEGYWQTERYFKDIADSIRADFTLIDAPDDTTRSLIEGMNKHSAVSLHVRRGLYVTHPVFSAVHGACGPDYFEKAIAYISERVQSPHFYIFSDDHVWAKEHIKPPFPTTYVDHTNAETPHADILLMSSCKHHIIANSTFSWWGAWLNPSPEKIVVGPSKWFNQGKYNTADILPAAWIRI